MRREDLYIKYCQELARYLLDPVTDVEEYRRWYKNHVEDPLLVWRSIRSQDGPPEEVGFLILQPNLNAEVDAGNKKLRVDTYISEAYVAPQHRWGGLMTRKVAKALKEFPGTYVLEVYTSNTGARRAWGKIFSRLGYEEHDLGLSPREDIKNMNLLVYSPKAKPKPGET